jgi:hypothetical protein
MVYIPVPPDCFLHELARVPGRVPARWRSYDGQRLYEWDQLHGEVEVYDRRGRHRGVADARSGEVIKPAVHGRRIDV